MNTMWLHLRVNHLKRSPLKIEDSFVELNDLFPVVKIPESGFKQYKKYQWQECGVG